jgi:tetratricopeptide (TPR) repeat protein
MIVLLVGCNSDNKGGQTAEALYREGQALETKPDAGRQDFMAARDAYTQALQLQSSPELDARIRAGLANASYWLDDYPTAIREWTTAYPNLADDATRSFVLYRIGLCQQRLGQFGQADQTFAKVQQEFPGTDAAKRAGQHQGIKGFTVQLATFANPKSADAEIDKLRRQGVAPAKAQSATGTVVSVGPVQTYAQAMDLKNRFAATYPQAVIVP